MKSISLFLIFLLASACSTYGIRFSESNVSEDSIMYIQKGMTRSKVLATIGKPGDRVKLKNGLFLDVYTYDRLDGPMVHCQNFVIIYDEKYSNVYESNVVNGTGPQSRCNAYSRMNAQYVENERIVWNSVANSVNQNYPVNSSLAESNNSCYGDHNCSSGSKCFKKKNELEGICAEVYYSK